MTFNPQLLQSVRHLVTRTGNKIPQIALGTFQLGGEEGVSIIRKAIQSGYTFIDTAQYYNNQQQIGQAIKESGVARENLYISGKLSFLEFGQSATKSGCESILKNLQTNYLDLLLIHWPGLAGLHPNSPQHPKLRLKTWNTMIQLKQQGLVKDIGVANFLPRHLDHLKQNSAEMPVLNQLQINPGVYDKHNIEYCRKHNILIAASSPLSHRPPVLLQHPSIVQLANKYKRTPSQIILNWGLMQGFIVCPKSSKIEYLENNLDIFNFSLSPEEVNAISNLNVKVGKVLNPQSIKY